jgi:hypothetical protein
VLNGAFREAILLPALGKPFALVLSGILLSALILVVAFVFVPRFGRVGRSQSLYLGLIWLVLTLAFELGFGRWVQGRSWSELMRAYTFEDGNLWPLVLVVTFFAPLLAVRWREGSGRASKSGA